MIYENNYYYIGATAIIFKFPCDDPALEMINSNGQLDDFETWKTRTGIIEMGLIYRKASESSDNIKHIVLPYPNQSFGKGGEDPAEYEVEEESYVYSVVRQGWGLYAHDILQPIRVVIKNLELNTEYKIGAYYKKSEYDTQMLTDLYQVKTQSIIGNSRCTGTTGGTTEQNATLLATCSEACNIYNSMGKSWDFTYDATVGGNPPGSAADDGMHFGPAYIDKLSVVMHEMAHHIMKIVNYNPDFYNGEDRKATLWENYNNEVTKFMEFATNVEGASWRWQGTHNYPVISSYDYGKVGNYLVAAACQISRVYSEGY